VAVLSANTDFLSCSTSRVVISASDEAIQAANSHEAAISFYFKLSSDPARSASKASRTARTLSARVEPWETVASSVSSSCPLARAKNDLI
jgi:3-methyladenine DNA glycosylase/8-oxoguanine DNA glycosylase